MKRSSQADPIDTRRGGFALFTVVIMILVVAISAFGFFDMASRETGQALYRQESAEAFALADGAIERARAEFLVDRRWTAGFDTTAGRGSYTLSVSRQAYTDEDGVTHPYAVRLDAEGVVERARRRIEVWSTLPPTAGGMMFLIVGSMNIRGNMNVYDGEGHVNGSTDFGPNDVYLRTGSYTSGFELEPPVAHTEPQYYPGATYYRVRVNYPFPSILHARIERYDPVNGVFTDLTSALGDSLTGILSMSGTNFTYDFSSPALLTHYFDQVTGIFRRTGADSTVVVNFGEPALPPLATSAVSSVNLTGMGSYSMRSTIINTRCWNPSAPLSPTSWTGGRTTVKLMDCEPINGLGLLVHDFMTNGLANCYLGTDLWPSLTYVTGNVVDLSANGEVWGSIIVLGSWGDLNNPTTGGPDLHFDPGYAVRLPGYLGEGWDVGGSGTMDELSWREIAAGN